MMFKKLMSVLLAVTLVLSLLTMAFAEAPSEAAEQIPAAEEFCEAAAGAAAMAEPAAEEAASEPVPEADAVSAAEEAIPAAEVPSDSIPGAEAEEVTEAAEPAAEPEPSEEAAADHTEPEALPGPDAGSAGEEAVAADAQPENSAGSAPEAVSYPWSALTDEAFAAFILASENESLLREVLAAAGSDALIDLLLRVAAIEDLEVKRTVEAYLEVLRSHNEGNGSTGTIEYPTAAPAPTTEPTTTSPAEETTEPETQPPVDTAQLQAFVTRLYSICLSRAPAAEELDYYVSQLAARTTTGIIVAYNFVFSGEFRNMNLCNDHYVTYLYRVFFDRAPGADEISYHVGRLTDGARREDIFNGFALSPEYGALCESYGIAQGTGIDASGEGTAPTGACTVPGCPTAAAETETREKVAEFVRRLYTVCLGRAEVSNEEVDYYVSRLTGHLIDGNTTAWFFFSSPEYTGRGLSAAEHVTVLYQVLLGRDPGESEVSYHVSRMEAGASAEEMFNGFAMSDEFLAICQSYGIDRGEAIPLPLPAAPAVVYRALLVGNDYENVASTVMSHCKKDAQTMAGMLSYMTATPYTSTVLTNQTAAQTLTAISETFADAAEDDVSLFYFSGICFGNTGNLAGNDKSALKLTALKAALDAVPGKKIVIIEANKSGMSINKAEDLTEAALAARILSVFSSSAKAGELAADDYYVLTACSSTQNNYYDSPHGYSWFTFYLERACGWDHISNAPTDGTVPADVNQDGVITLNELWTLTFAAVSAVVGESQSVRVNPEGSDFVLFGR